MGIVHSTLNIMEIIKHRADRRRASSLIIATEKSKHMQTLEGRWQKEKKRLEPAQIGRRGEVVSHSHARPTSSAPASTEHVAASAKGGPTQSYRRRASQPVTMQCSAVSVQCGQKQIGMMVGRGLVKGVLSTHRVRRRSVRCGFGGQCWQQMH